MANEPWAPGNISADLRKAEAQAQKMHALKVAEEIKNLAGEALQPAADSFTRAGREAFAAGSPFDFGVLDPRGAGAWRGGVKARVMKKNARLSLLALAPHDLSKWGRGKMSHPFMGNRSKWYDRSVPDWKGVGTRTGKVVKAQTLSELGTSIAEMLEQKLS